jgi:hypothetical protein
MGPICFGESLGDLLPIDYQKCQLFDQMPMTMFDGISLQGTMNQGYPQRTWPGNHSASKKICTAMPFEGRSFGRQPKLDRTYEEN